ncbi:MAG: PAS domain S-box protein [Acidobacteria bacterium]|nr:PAS domain S-box protein [Acidobacteriota bacterium]
MAKIGETRTVQIGGLIMEPAREALYEVLRLSEQKFRLAFDNAPMGMALVGSDLRLQRVNKAYCDALGYSEEELLNRSCIEITHPDDIEKEIELTKQLLRGEIPSYRIEKRNISKDKQIVWLDLTALVVRGRDGEALYGLALAENITEHKKAEAALRESEKRYRAFFELTAVGAGQLDPANGRYISVNDGFCTLTGYSRDELLGMRFSDITHPEDLERDQNKVKELIRGDIPSFDCEKRYVRADGSIIWARVNVTMVRDDNGNPLYTVWIVQDINDCMMNEEALRKSEERYRSFVMNSSEAIWRFESDQPIDTTLPVDEQIALIFKYSYLTECNNTMAKMYGLLRPEEILGARLGDLILPMEENNLATLRAFIHNGYRITDLETLAVDKDGNQKYFMNNVMGVVENGFVVRVWGMQHDITERKRADDQLRDSRQQMRALAARIQSMREEERASIAREIHDTLGQSLTSIKIDLSWIAKKLPEDADEAVREKLMERFRAALNLVEETLIAVKNLSAELRPRVLDTFGLSAAIEWQCSEFEKRTGIKSRCRLPKSDVLLNPEMSTALFRILQETLTNVARHSQASTVFIELSVGDGHANLKIRDNGNGVTEEQITSPGSLGMLGMRERADFLGGEIVVKGEPGNGTLVTVRMPLNQKEAK